MYDIQTTTLIFDLIAAQPTRDHAIGTLAVTLNAAYLRGTRDALVDTAVWLTKSAAAIDADVAATAFGPAVAQEAYDEAFDEAPEDHSHVEGDIVVDVTAPEIPGAESAR